MNTIKVLPEMPYTGTLNGRPHPASWTCWVAGMAAPSKIYRVGTTYLVHVAGRGVRIDQSAASLADAMDQLAEYAASL